MSSRKTVSIYNSVTGKTKTFEGDQYYDPKKKLLITLNPSNKTEYIVQPIKERPKGIPSLDWGEYVRENNRIVKTINSVFVQNP